MTFLKLIRYKNLFMVLLTMVLVKYALINRYASHALSDSIFTLVCLSILCLTAGGYVINDVLDIPADTINKPRKTYIGQSISLKSVYILYGILTLTGVALCYYVIRIEDLSYAYLWTYVITILLLFLYSKYLKKLPLLGNILIALFCAGIVFIIFLLDFQDYSAEQTEAKTFSQMLENGELVLFVIFYGVFSFLTTMVREIIKDIEDIDGDHLMKMKTLPIILGRKRAQQIAIGHSFLLILVLIFVLKTLFQDPDYLNLGMYLLMSTLVPLLYFTYLLWTAKKKRHFENLSTLMKIIMLLGILSMILFTFD